MSPEWLIGIMVTIQIAIVGGLVAAMRHADSRTDKRLDNAQAQVDALEERVEKRFQAFEAQEAIRHSKVMDALTALNLKVAESYFPSAQADRLEQRIMGALAEFRTEIRAEVRGLQRRRSDEEAAAR